MNKVIRINPAGAQRYSLVPRPRTDLDHESFTGIKNNPQSRHPCFPWFGCGLTTSQKTTLLDQFVRSIQG